MTKHKDEAESGLTGEIRRTMEEAEAAVSALDDAGGRESDETAELTTREDELAATVVELEAEVSQIKDRWLRAVADLENHKKRVKRELDEVALRTVQQVLPSFLPTMDNLERALEVAAPEAGSEQLVRGIQMVRDEFMSALRKHGIEPVPSVGCTFDPAIHDALQQVESADHPPGVVIREFERGYRMGERLLRPARVVIAGPGSTGAATEGGQRG